MNDISKKWQSNAVLHPYYQQMKGSIESFPCMTPRTLHQYKPIAKLCADRHFIYIIVSKDEIKEELQSYYKLTDENMEYITKERPEEFLVPIADAELSDVEIIGNPLVTWVKHVGQTNAKKKKKKEEVQDVETDEQDKASEGNGSGSLGGGGDEVDGKGGGDEG
jgi:hypothetical protein